MTRGWIYLLVIVCSLSFIQAVSASYVINPDPANSSVVWFSDEVFPVGDYVLEASGWWCAFGSATTWYYSCGGSCSAKYYPAWGGCNDLYTTFRLENSSEVRMCSLMDYTENNAESSYGYMNFTLSSPQKIGVRIHDYKEIWYPDNHGSLTFTLTSLSATPTPTPTPTATPTPIPLPNTFINWDESEYYNLETAIITYTIAGSDWNTANYRYYGGIKPSGGDDIFSWEITSQPDDAVQSYSIDSSHIPASGTYTCYLVAIERATGKETIMDLDNAMMYLDEKATVFGTTYDSVNATALSGCSVSMTQSGGSSSTTSDASGKFTFDSLYLTFWASLNATKSGYTGSPVGFTPLSAITYNLDIPMIPSGGAEPGAWNSSGNGSGYTTTTYGNTNTSYWNTSDGTAVGGYVTVWGGYCEGATVTLENGTWSDTYTTITDGWYIFTEAEDGVVAGTYDITVNKTGYETITTTVILIEDYFARKDFYLGAGSYTTDSPSGTNTSYWTTADGTSCGGVVYNGPSWTLGGGSTVSIANATWSTLMVTDVGGWWQFKESNGLIDNGIYTITVSQTGYDTVIANITCLADNFTRKDFYLSENYDITIHIKDSETESYITTGNVSATLGSTTVAVSDGTAEFTDLAYGTYSLYVSADGYYAWSGSVPVDSADDSETVFLSKEETPGENGPGSNYPPHLVRFTFIDAYGNPVDGATVTATAVESSTPWGWVSGAFGFDTDTVDIRNTTLSGISDSGGSVAFMMIETVRYSVNCVDATEGIDHTVSIYPKESEYIIRCGSTLPTAADYPSYDLNCAAINTSYCLLTANYTDTADDTSSVVFSVTNSSGSVLYNASVPLTAGVGAVNYTVANTRGESYTYGITASNTNHGTITAYQSATMKGSGKLVDFGWPNMWYALISLACVFMVAGSMGELDVRVGAIFVPIVASIFWYIGWMPISTGLIINIVFFIGAFYYIRSKMKELET